MSRFLALVERTRHKSENGGAVHTRLRVVDPRGRRGALARVIGGTFGVTGSPLDECEGGERFGDSRKEPDLARCREQRGQCCPGAFKVFAGGKRVGEIEKQYVRESAHAQPPSERDRSVESVDRGGYLAAETRQARSITQGERFVDVDPVLGEEDRASRGTLLRPSSSRL